MKSNILAGSVVAILGAAPAFADMAFKTPAAVVASNWTGFYVGGSLGGRWNSDRWITTSIAASPPGPFSAFPGNNPTTFKSGEFRYGLYGGYNWQISPIWVIGIEGDFAWTTKTDRQRIIGIPGTFDPITGLSGNDFAGVDDTWDASIRGRLGILDHRFHESDHWLGFIWTALSCRLVRESVNEVEDHDRTATSI